METTCQKIEESDTHTIPKHLTKSNCGYFDWIAYAELNCGLQEIKGDPGDHITQRTLLS